MRFLVFSTLEKSRWKKRLRLVAECTLMEVDRLMVASNHSFV